MDNLLSNTWKFTPRGGAIQVGAEQEDGQAVLRIQDNGSGIAAEELAHIFEMFRQVHAPLEREHGGLGLGLTLVKTLVELHNGTVEARSAGIGHGTEFIVRLPVSDLSRSASHEGPGDDQSAIVQSRILVMDDNRAAADSLSMLLN